MANPRFTQGPWEIGDAYQDDEGYREIPIHSKADGKTYTPASVCLQFTGARGMQEANARLIASAPDLYDAAVLLEAAEDAHANCPECDGEVIPELCPVCFPLFDDARLKRRAALAKARGEP